MLNIIDRVEEADRLKWSQLVSSACNGSLFQMPEFYDFLKESEEHNPFVFIGEHDGSYDYLVSGSIQFSKNRLVRPFSRRAIVNGGMVTRDGADCSELPAFLNSIAGRLKGRAVYLEIRNLHDYSRLAGFFDGNGFSRIPHLNYQVEITSVKETFSRLNQSRRRQVRKSLEGGAEVIVNPGSEEVMEFYAILRETYHRRVHKPLPDVEMFLRFHRTGPGVYLLIRYNGRIIGGIMCPVFGKNAIYEWYVAGEDGRHQGIYPSVLATWAAIEYGAMNGIGIFDFMGAGRPDEDYGVREFKSKFGGRQVEHGRFLKVFNKPVYNVGRLLYGKSKRNG
ncbi:MAG TPA: hypothetical protein DIS74_06225 [Bacteroidales bacterium]|nr:hypothetical protein [Bacteroidales bacterium]